MGWRFGRLKMDKQKLSRMVVAMSQTNIFHCRCVACRYFIMICKRQSLEHHGSNNMNNDDTLSIYRALRLTHMKRMREEESKITAECIQLTKQGKYKFKEMFSLKQHKVINAIYLFNVSLHKCIHSTVLFRY